jgi:hypothetical protein
MFLINKKLNKNVSFDNSKYCVYYYCGIRYQITTISYVLYVSAFIM